MAFFSVKLKMAIFLHFLFFLLSFTSTALELCPLCDRKGKVSYISQDSALSSGNCGYGSMALDFNHGYLASTPSFNVDGGFCGGCFRIKCKNKRLCKKEGTTVIVTDEVPYSNSSKIDFALSRKAYMAMARKGMEKQLLKHRAVDVIYKQYSCDFFDKKNLTLRVEESSKHPDYLAVKPLYLSGKTHIRFLDASQVGTSDYVSFRRNHGAVWEAHNVTYGPLKFEFNVNVQDDDETVFAKNVFPADWKPGMMFDTGVQIHYYSWEGCSECAEDNW